MRTRPRPARAYWTVIAGLLLAGGALAGCGGGGTPTAASSPAASSAVSGAASGAASPAPTGGSTGSGGSAQAGGPVPAGFAASSVTFVSADEAYVLGTAPCRREVCTSIVRTLDRGKTWRGVPAPTVPLGHQGGQGPAVWGIRFASPTTGFVYGNGLWETTDSGEHWSKVPGTPTDFADLEISDGQLLALVTSCTMQGSCSGTSDLMHRPVSGGTFTLDTSLTTSRPVAAGYNVAAVLNGSRVFVTSNGGNTVTAHQLPCDTDNAEPSQVAVVGKDSLALLCVGEPGAGSVPKTVYVSGDLGGRWAKAGSPSPGGDSVSVAGESVQRVTVAASSGASALYYTPNAGKTWTTSYRASDGGMGFADLGFTTPTDGVVVHGPALTDGNSEKRPGQLLLTSNGGASWTPVTW